MGRTGVDVHARHVFSAVLEAQRREHARADADVEHARRSLLGCGKLLDASLDGAPILEVAIGVVQHAEKIFCEAALRRVVRHAPAWSMPSGGRAVRRVWWEEKGQLVCLSASRYRFPR